MVQCLIKSHNRGEKIIVSFLPLTALTFYKTDYMCNENPLLSYETFLRSKELQDKESNLYNAITRLTIELGRILSLVRIIFGIGKIVPSLQIGKEVRRIRRILSLTLSLYSFLSLTLSLSLSLSTHFSTHFSLSHTLSLSLLISLSHTLSLSHAHSHTHTHSLLLFWV